MVKVALLTIVYLHAASAMVVHLAQHSCLVCEILQSQFELVASISAALPCFLQQLKVNLKRFVIVPETVQAQWNQVIFGHLPTLHVACLRELLVLSLASPVAGQRAQQQVVERVFQLLLLTRKKQRLRCSVVQRLVLCR